MAAGEYVSVSSQADTEHADLAKERRELRESPEAEREELAAIYRGRGLDSDLARQVAEQLMAKDALEAHAREELGIVEFTRARPVQAALASAASFAVGATPPAVLAAVVPGTALTPVVVVLTLILLLGLGGLAARIGGASVIRGAVRVTFWGAIAMGVTAAVGWLFGTII